MTTFKRLILLAASMVLLSGCSLPHSPAPTATPAMLIEPTDSPTVPQGHAAVNLFEQLDLGKVETIEMIPHVPGATNVIMEGELAQELARAWDVPLVLASRSSCEPTYSLVFDLGNGDTVELGVVGCDLEHPPLVRGQQPVLCALDAQTTEALGRMLGEIASPMLPHPSPTEVPGEPVAQPVPAEVRGAFEQALARLRGAELAQAPSTDLIWTIVPATPPGVLGATHYKATADDWGALIIAPVVAPNHRQYAIRFFHHATAFEWAVRIAEDGYEVLPGEPMAPAPTPVGDAVPSAIHDALGRALVYLHATYGDDAPEQGLIWDISSATPEGIVGAAWYDINAPGWEGRITAPVVAPQHQTYDVTLRNRGSDREWVLVVDARGHVVEQPSAAAGAVRVLTHGCEDKGLAISYRTDWRMAENATLGGHEGVVTLARDGWILAINVATRQEDLPQVMGGAAGAWQTREPIAVGRASLNKQVLVHQDRIKALKYYGLVDGRIVYVHLLDQMRQPYDQISVPVGLEHEVDTIVRSLSLN